jgi:hypothetical protein
MRNPLYRIWWSLLLLQVTYMYYTGRLEVFNENFPAVSTLIPFKPCHAICLSFFFCFFPLLETWVVFDAPESLNLDLVMFMLIIEVYP